MRAAYLARHAGPEELILGELPRPQAARGDVLVKVHASAVTPTEFKWSPTFKTRTGEPRSFPIVLGHEFSGTVEEVGEGVKGLGEGDAVYGMNDWFVNGAQAEYCVAPGASVASAPRTLEHMRAAVVPISALTAWQGLFGRCRLKAGERVLIHGGSGAVDVFAVQLAHRNGAYVIATASSPNVEFVRNLGADEVVDYQSTPFDKAVRDIDVVFDTVGAPTLDLSWRVLRSGGRLATIAAQSEALNEPRVREAFFIVEPNQGQLTEIAELLDSGKVHAFVQKVFGLSEAREAYARAKRGRMRGKIALHVTSGR